ncbi:MAG: hypothetical protein WA431_14590 [Candidatus Cybelea sp.]
MRVANFQRVLARDVLPVAAMKESANTTRAIRRTTYIAKAHSSVQVKLQESANVPKRDTVVKTSGDKLESVVGPWQFVPQKPFQTKLDDVIATRR